MPRPETVLQRAILRHLTKQGFYAVHVPNGAVLGGNRKARAIQVNNLKADGMKVGFPDLSVYTDQGRIGHIEVKTGDGEQSKAQLDCQAILEGMGHKYAICRCVEDADAALVAWGWV